jgi:hypothetical protein
VIHPEIHRFLTPSLFTTLSPGASPPIKTVPEYKEGLGGGEPPVASIGLTPDINITNKKDPKAIKLALRIKTHYSYILKKKAPLSRSWRGGPTTSALELK